MAVEPLLDRFRVSSVTWIVGAAIMFTASGVFAWANLSGRVADLEKAQTLKVATDAAAQVDTAKKLDTIQDNQAKQSADIAAIKQQLTDMAAKK